MPAMKVKLIANQDDIVVLKAKVAASAAGVDLVVESPKSVGVIPELHYGIQVVKHTNAILRCIGCMYDDNELTGTNFFESGQVDAWLDWAQLQFGDMEQHGAPGAAQDDSIQVLEKHLASRTFLVGERYTLADVALSCALHRNTDLSLNVKRWLGTCTANQAFKASAASSPAAASTTRDIAPAAKAAASKGSAAKGGSPDAGKAASAKASTAGGGMNRDALIASCMASKERRIPTAMPYAKLKLVASSDDPCILKACVAAKAANIDLAVEASAAGAAPELHQGNQVVRYSSAILRCIGRVFEGGDIYGRCFQEAGEIDSWLDWAQVELCNDQPLVVEAVEALARHLDGRTFLVGQRLSLADVSISCTLFLLQHFGSAFPTLPCSVQRWLGTCLAHEAFTAVAGKAVATLKAAPKEAKVAAEGSGARSGAAASTAQATSSNTPAASKAALVDLNSLVTSCVASKDRRLPSAPAFAKLRLVASSNDPCAIKACVVARATKVDLAVEAPAGGGLVFPELHCGNRVVRHAGAILRCIGRIYDGGDIYGQNFQQAGEIDSWLDWTELELKMELSCDQLQEPIKALERHLEGRTFLVGQRYTLADASLSCTLFLLQQCRSTLPALPQSVERWLKTCTAQEAFTAVVSKALATATRTSPEVASKAEPKSATAAKAVATPAANQGGAPADARTLTAPYSSAVGGRVTIKRVLAVGEGLVGQKITVCGWVRTMRSQKAVSFVKLNDGSSPHCIQIVLDANVPGYDTLKNCGTGASLKCIGKLVASPGEGQSVELLLKDQDDEVVLLGGVDGAADYPLAKGKHSKEFLRQHAHLRPRALIMGAMARVRASLAQATHEFFRERDFIYVHTPCITAADCEGAGEMFQVTTLLSDADEKGVPLTQDKKIDYSKDFFGKPAFMTVSGQLSVENYCCALSSVYTFGPTFRAENSHTARHLAEFWMIEPELAFADIFDDMTCAEDYLKYCVKYAMEHNRADLELFQENEEKGLIQRLENLLAQPFERLTYTRAIDILLQESKKAKFSVPVEWGMDLGSEHERYLAEKVFKKPIILYNYPKDIKAFYMRLNDDEKTVAAMDVLAPGIGEVIGGSQREERLDVLDRRLGEVGLDAKDYWWYRDLRRFGSVPHSGFGLGFERLIMLVTGLENIRDTIPFPRYPGHAEF